MLKHIVKNPEFSTLKVTVMYSENALVNNRLCVSKISWKFRISTIFNFAVIYLWNLLFSQNFTVQKLEQLWIKKILVFVICVEVIIYKFLQSSLEVYLSSLKRSAENFYEVFTHFMLLVSSYTLWKYQKLSSFLILLGDIERKQWHEMC